MSPAKVLDKHGNVVAVGDIVTDFRGKSGTFQGVSRPPVNGKSAKIIVDGKEFYERTYDLYVEPLAE